MVDALTGTFVLLGTFFMLVAAVGVARLPDIFLRMHATTKASTVGIVFLATATGLHFQDAGIVARSVLIVVFFLLTAPIAAQVIGRTAYLHGVTLWNRTVVDEYRGTVLDPEASSARTMVGEARAPETASAQKD